MMVVDGSERTLDCDNSGKKKRRKKHSRYAIVSPQGVQFLGCQGCRGKRINRDPAFTGHLSTLWAGAWEALFKFYSKTI